MILETDHGILVRIADENDRRCRTGDFNGVAEPRSCSGTCDDDISHVTVGKSSDGFDDIFLHTVDDDLSVFFTECDLFIDDIDQDRFRSEDLRPAGCHESDRTGSEDNDLHTGDDTAFADGVLSDRTRFDHAERFICRIFALGFYKVPVGRDETVFRHTSVAAGAEVVVVVAHRIVGCLARVALHAWNAWEDGSSFADERRVGIFADCDDASAEFMTQSERIFLFGCSEFEDPRDVRSADTAGCDFYQKLLSCRFRDLDDITTKISDRMQSCCFHFCHLFFLAYFNSVATSYLPCAGMIWMTTSTPLLMSSRMTSFSCSDMEMFWKNFFLSPDMPIPPILKKSI